MAKRLLSYQTRRAASALTLTAPADSESLSKPSFRLGLNQIQPRQCTSTAGAAFLVLRGEEPINQTLEGVDATTSSTCQSLLMSTSPFPGLPKLDRKEGYPCEQVLMAEEMDVAILGNILSEKISF